MTQNYRFGEICDVLNGRAYKQNELLSSGKYPVLRVGNFFSSDRWYYSDMELPENKYCDNEDLLFAWSASFGPKIWDGGKVIYHYHIWKLVPDTSKADKYYLYYWLKHSVNRLTAGTHGSVMAHMTKGDMENQQIELPSLDVQKKVSSILKTLDDKIKLNNEINSNLFEQVKTLYYNMINSDCNHTSTKLSELCDFQEGYVNPSQSHSEYFEGEIKWLRAVDINESFIINTSRTLSKQGFESAGKSALLFKPDTIAISKSGTVGRLGIIADYMCGNRAVINITPKDASMITFIYSYLQSKQAEFPDLAVGSVQKNLYVSVLADLDVQLPDEKYLKIFSETTIPLYNTISNNCKECLELALIRDTLLPKLMSGEIDLSNISI